MRKKIFVALDNSEINDALSITSEIKEYIANSENYQLTEPILNAKKNKYQLIYIYDTQQSQERTLKSSWGDIEELAKNKKNNDLLITLIKKLKHNAFIQYYK